MHEKQKAKLLILEIIRQAGGSFTNKTNLFKAFYYAHLQYAAKHPGFLSTWPIVRMPMGPGIDKFDLLVGELVAEGMLEIEEVKFGEHSGFKFILTPSATRGTLDSDACEAIASGVDAVRGKSAERVSRDSHEQSASWRDAKDGEELSIYADLFSDVDYAYAKARAEQGAEILRRLS